MQRIRNIANWKFHVKTCSAIIKNFLNSLAVSGGIGVPILFNSLKPCRQNWNKRFKSVLWNKNKCIHIMHTYIILKMIVNNKYKTFTNNGPWKW